MSSPHDIIPAYTLYEHSLFLSLYSVYMCICMCVHAGMHGHIWRPEEDVRCLSLLLSVLEKDSLAEPRSCCFFPRLVASKLQWSLSIGICGHIWPAVPAFYVGARVPNRGPHAD